MHSAFRSLQRAKVCVRVSSPTKPPSTTPPKTIPPSVIVEKLNKYTSASNKVEEAAAIVELTEMVVESTVVGPIQQLSQQITQLNQETQASISEVKLMIEAKDTVQSWKLVVAVVVTIAALLLKDYCHRLPCGSFLPA
jgi:hypothetical protein